MKIRIRIREQLCLLIGFTSLLPLMILSVAVWTQSYHYLRTERAERLRDIALLKADQLARDLALFQASIRSKSTRDDIQADMRSYNGGNTSNELLDSLKSDIDAAISGRASESIYLQAAIYPNTYRAGQTLPIVRATAQEFLETYILPYTTANESKIYLGDTDAGYPAQLYPNISYSTESNTSVVAYNGKMLTLDSTLLLGPYYINANLSLISMTVSINDNTSGTEVLGWLTIVVNAENIRDIVNSKAGVGHTGGITIVGPATTDNRFDRPLNEETMTEVQSIDVQVKATSFNDPSRKLEGISYPSFEISQYPAILEAWSTTNSDLDNAGSMTHSHDENGQSISVGYSLVSSNIVDWMLLFEQSRHEVMGPLNALRDTIFECVFPVVTAVCIFSFVFAQYAVKPISALRTATANSVAIYETQESPDTDSTDEGKSHLVPKNPRMGSFLTFRNSKQQKTSGAQSRMFQIPAKVPVKQHLIQDELTELTLKFNEMVDELVIQYERLEHRVQSRTAELESSRNEAQAANESKTLFIANVSHELRTPLNGVIGMCAVAMQEEDVIRIRQSLNIIYKSSDLLLHLLNDLLTFSRSSYDQQLTIEEEVFCLQDIGTQLISLFEKQAGDAEVSMKVVFIGAPGTEDSDHNIDLDDSITANVNNITDGKRSRPAVLAHGPANTGPIRDLALRGDKNRILQILMNLVSNSLKFTSAQGQIEIRMRCYADRSFNLADHNSCSQTVPSIPIQRHDFTQPELPHVERGLPREEELDVTRKTVGVDFEVEDTGTGIPEHMLQEVFKPFVQADLTLSKKHGGTGLGLAICSQLAKLMHGAIRVRSTVGIGSQFTLSLPLKYTKEKVPSISDSLARSVRGTSVSSSIHFDTFSTRSGRTRASRTRPQSIVESVIQPDTSSTALENPRVVGYSQPFVVHHNRSVESVRPPPEMHRYNRLDTIQSISMEVEPSEAPQTISDIDRVPHETVELKAASDAPTAITKPSERKVLVAEDNSVNQQVILRLLKLEKVSEVTLAENGEEALAAIQNSLFQSDSQQFTLVFMDIQMPKMDGIECTKRIRALEFTAPIVALTAFDHETNRKSCKDAGMNDFLPKPIKRTALKNVLKAYG